jgi:hypothetical protein
LDKGKYAEENGGKNKENNDSSARPGIGGSTPLKSKEKADDARKKE